MSAFVIAQINITDPRKYEEYKKLAPGAVAAFGGKIHVRGGETTDLEGKRPYPRLVVIEFESVAKAKQWYDSPQYRVARKAREGAADAVFTVVEGV